MDELTKQLLEDLYNETFVFVDSTGQVLQISEERALDIMVLGYRGTIAVRKFRGWKFENGKLIVPQSFSFINDKKQEDE